MDKPCHKCGGTGRILKIDYYYIDEPEDFDPEEDVFESYCECPAGATTWQEDIAHDRRQLREWKADGSLEERRPILRERYDLSDEEIDALASDEEA